MFRLIIKETLTAFSLTEKCSYIFQFFTKNVLQAHFLNVATT